MDIRENIIQEVIAALEDCVTEDMINVVQDVLVIELNKYEVQERCTDLEVLGTSAEGMLKKFIATKRIEGIGV